MELSHENEPSILPAQVPNEYFENSLSAQICYRYWQDETLIYLRDAVMPTLLEQSFDEDDASHLEYAIYEQTRVDLWQGAKEWQDEAFADDLIVNHLQDEAFRRIKTKNQQNT